VLHEQLHIQAERVEEVFLTESNLLLAGTVILRCAV
jgi:hypothetical protein